MKIKNKLIILFLFILFFILFDTSSFAFEIDDTNVWNCIQEALDYGNSCYDLNYSLTDFQDIFVVGNEAGGLFYTFYFLLPNYELSYFFTGNSQCEVFLKNYLSVGYNRDNSVFLEPSTYGEYTAYKPCYYSDANFTGYFPNSSVDKNWKKLCSPQIDCQYNNTKRPYGHVLYSTVSLWYAGECGIENPNLDFTSIPKPSIPTEDYVLYIDDFNFMKRFKFQFKIPLLKEDTKVFCFLQKYKRNSYDSVTADFKFYTVSTPEGYDYTDYKNYMYYDEDDKKLYLPAGCTVQCYTCTAFSGDVYGLDLFNEYVAYRSDDLCNNVMLVDELITAMVKNGVFPYDNELAMSLANNTFINYSNYLVQQNLIRPDETVLSYLFPTNTYLSSFNRDSTFMSVFDKLKFSYNKGDFSFNIIFAEFLNFFGLSDNLYRYYSDFKHVLYYSWRGASIKDITSFSDFAFATTPIYSYESEKKPVNRSNTIYNVYRNTQVYTMNNKINDNTYYINYSDNQNVTSMIPEGVDIDYLTSPFYKGNDESSSGGNITYDIQEVIQGDKVIDYSKEDNSIHNNINNKYIENWVDGDNITIYQTDNPSIEKIEKTSTEILGVVRSIYFSVLRIETELGKLGDNISNVTNNLSYNIDNGINYYFIPNPNILKSISKNIDEASEKNLGILYEGTDFLIYTCTLFANIDNPNEIVLHIPEIKIWDTVLIQEITFNFTAFMNEDIPALSTIHNIYLTAIDFVILGLLVLYIMRLKDEVVEKK